ncbi:MAG TPA: DUF2934 domain-containing protein [Bryobacteraceae bacterium]|nr:DUF2934 domain-containing protein [Bryobacteraceae bacterium]
MARKRNTESEHTVPAGVTPARPVRKTTRAKHTAKPGVEQMTAAVVPDAPKPAPEDGPSHEEVARLAYSYWQARGCQGGSAEEDWHRAEAELRTRVMAASA